MFHPLTMLHPLAMFHPLTMLHPLAMFHLLTMLLVVVTFTILLRSWIIGPAMFDHAAIAKLAVQRGVGARVVEFGVAIGRGDGASQAGDAQVAQAIYADISGDLFNCATGGDQLAFLRDVDAEIAGMAQGRRA